MSTCNETLKAENKPCPRTCAKCGLGPCVGRPPFSQAPATPTATEPVLAYAVLWSYSDRSAFGVVSVHRTRASADRMVNLLVKHAETKTFTVEPVPSEP